MFRLSNQSLNYGHGTVLDNLSLHIQQGEKVALIGPSGSGKSTLLNALYQQQADQIALCPQQCGLVDILSVYHNIYMGQLECHSTLYNVWNLIRPMATPYQQVSQIAAELGLSKQIDRSVDCLSGGQQRRVAIGRALYRQQPIFFGDEPVAGLDPLQAKMVLELVLSRHQSAVVALHNRHLALSVFDRVIGINGGKIMLDRPAEQLCAADLDAFYVE